MKTPIDALIDLRNEKFLDATIVRLNAIPEEIILRGIFKIIDNNLLSPERNLPGPILSDKT